MIVTSMSDAEIQQQVEKDMPEIMAYIDSRDKKYRREVIKALSFPLYFEPIYRKSKAGNTWLILLTAKTKKDKNDSHITMFCYFNSTHGWFAVMPTSTNGRLHYNFFQPHFFSRFASRTENTKHGVDLMVQYFRHNNSFAYQIKKIEYQNTLITEVYATTESGIALGVMLKNGNFLFKTFITYPMMKGEQIEQFTNQEQIRKEIHNA